MGRGGCRGGGGGFSGGGGVGGFHSRGDYGVRKAGAIATMYSPRYDAGDIPILNSPRHPDYNKTLRKYNLIVEEWYNRCSPEERWERAIDIALEYCPKDGRRRLGLGTLTDVADKLCHRYMELLVDCPPKKLEGYNLPPLSSLGTESLLEVPLKLKDPLSACNMWKTLLKRKHAVNFEHLLSFFGECSLDCFD